MTFEEYWFIVAEKTGKTVTKEQLKYYCEIAYGQGQASVINNDFNIFKEAVKEFDRLRGEEEEIQTGEWIGNELGQCSICGHKGCASDIWNGCNDKTYCPNCGALLE